MNKYQSSTPTGGQCEVVQKTRINLQDLMHDCDWHCEPQYPRDTSVQMKLNEALPWRDIP